MGWVAFFKIEWKTSLITITNDFRYLIQSDNLDDVLSSLEFDIRFSLEPVLVVPTLRLPNAMKIVQWLRMKNLKWKPK